MLSKASEEQQSGVSLSGGRECKAGRGFQLDTEPVDTGACPPKGLLLKTLQSFLFLNSSRS